MRRRVIDAVLQHSTRNTSLHLLIYNLGFAQAFLEYDRGPRVGGHSSWTLRKRLKLAVDMLTGCSAAPIRIASLVGILAGFLGILVGAVTLVRAALGAVPASGWASLMVISSFMGGLMLVAIAFLGEYAWRILDEVAARRPSSKRARQTSRAVLGTEQPSQRRPRRPASARCPRAAESANLRSVPCVAAGARE